MFGLKTLMFLFVIIIFLRQQNVFSSSSHSHCADIFSSKNFKGARLPLLDEVGWTYRGHLKLIPNSVKIKSACSLTMFDGKGNIQTIREDVQNLSWVSRNPVHSTCCHCGSCDKLKTSLKQCARIFHHENCNSCETPLDVSNDQEIKDFHLVRNKIGSVIVRDQCQLDVYYKVAATTWKILMKADLKSGNNFVEAFSIFNEEATVSVGKAVCSCDNDQWIY